MSSTCPQPLSGMGLEENTGVSMPAGSVKAVADKCTAQLGNIVGLVRGQLTKLQRATLSALVVMDVHNRSAIWVDTESILKEHQSSPCIPGSTGQQPSGWTSV